MMLFVNMCRCYILPIRYNAPPQFTLSKNCPLQWGSRPGPYSTYDSLGLPDPNSNSIESAVFPQYTLVADGETDRQNYNGTRPVRQGHLRSRPKHVRRGIKIGIYVYTPSADFFGWEFLETFREHNKTYSDPCSPTDVQSNANSSSTLHYSNIPF